MKSKYIFLFGIILLAVGIRTHYFYGISFSDTPDDLIYYNIIQTVKKGEYRIDNFDELIYEKRIDALDLFMLRLMLLFPNAFIITVFGNTVLSYSLFSLLSSLLNIILIFFFGKLCLENERAGLLAAFLAAIYPLDIILSTRLLAEMPLSLFINLSLFFLIYSDKIPDNEHFFLIGKRSLSLFLSGFFYSMAYYVKYLGVILTPMIILFFAYKLSIGKLMRKHLFFLLGAAPIIIMVSAYFFSQTGYFFLDKVANGQSYLEMVNTSKTTPEFMIGPVLVNSVWGGRIFDYFRYMFHRQGYYPGISYYGMYFIIFFLLLIVFIIRQNYYLKDNNSRIVLYLLVWIIASVLLLEFLPMHIEFNSAITVYLVQKEARYLCYITFPLMLFISYILVNSPFRQIFKKRIYRIASVIVILLLLVHSYNAIEGAYGYFIGSGAIDLRQASDYIKGTNQTIIYTDVWAKTLLGYYLEDTLKYELHEFPENFTLMKHPSLILTGGARGTNQYFKPIFDDLPTYARKLTLTNTANLSVAYTQNYKKSLFRKYDLRIYHYDGQALS